MNKTYTKYIYRTIYILITILMLIGLVEFIVKGNKYVTIANTYFGFMFGLAFLNIQPVPKGRKKFVYYIILFLCFYLPEKIGNLLGISGVTLTSIHYFMLLVILFIAATLLYYFNSINVKE